MKKLNFIVPTIIDVFMFSSNIVAENKVVVVPLFGSSSDTAEAAQKVSDKNGTELGTLLVPYSGNPVIKNKKINWKYLPIPNYSQGTYPVLFPV